MSSSATRGKKFYIHELEPLLREHNINFFSFRGIDKNKTLPVNFYAMFDDILVSFPPNTVIFSCRENAETSPKLVLKLVSHFYVKSFRIRGKLIFDFEFICEWSTGFHSFTIEGWQDEENNPYKNIPCEDEDEEEEDVEGIEIESECECRCFRFA